MKKQKKKNEKQLIKNIMITQKQHREGKRPVLFHRIGCRHR